MNEVVKIENAEISVKEYNGQRVVTFKDIDEVHGRTEGTARKRFADNKKHFVEGEDYFVRNTDEAKREYGIIAPNGLTLITEQGYSMLVKSFTDDLSWKVQRQLVNGYFRPRQIDSEELSPATKLMLHMANQLAENELKALEARKIAERALETAENIKEAVKPVFDNWREEMNLKFNRIQKSIDRPFNYLRNEMYSELERRAGCDLNIRLRNLHDRMNNNGARKTDINKTNKMDVIEQDKKLREIFSKIVTEFEIKYCA